MGIARIHGLMGESWHLSGLSPPEGRGLHADPLAPERRRLGQCGLVPTLSVRAKRPLDATLSEKSPLLVKTRLLPFERSRVQQTPTRLLVLWAVF